MPHWIWEPRGEEWELRNTNMQSRLWSVCREMGRYILVITMKNNLEEILFITERPMWKIFEARRLLQYTVSIGKLLCPHLSIPKKHTEVWSCHYILYHFVYKLWIQCIQLLLSSHLSNRSVTQSKLLKFSMPQFAHLQNGDNMKLIRLLWGVNELMLKNS